MVKDADDVLVDVLAPVGKAFAKDPTVTAFNSRSLCVDRKVFAMVVKGELVLKLPAERAAALVKAKEGRLHALGGRVMKEWFVSPVARKAKWVALAKEARAFVAG